MKPEPFRWLLREMINHYLDEFGGSKGVHVNFVEGKDADSAFPVFVDGEYHHTEGYVMGWNPDSVTISVNKREVRKTNR